MASDLAIQTAQRALDQSSTGLRLYIHQWAEIQKLIEWAVDAALNQVVDDGEGSLCRTTYSVLDELHEQLTEAAGEIRLDTLAGREGATKLIEDLQAVERVQRLVMEIVDPDAKTSGVQGLTSQAH